MRFDEYRRQDATALANSIAKKEVSAKEVLEAAITRAEQVNPAIKAIVHKQYDRARSAVAQGLPSGPLNGVPFLVKDLGFFENGEPAELAGRWILGTSPRMTPISSADGARGWLDGRDKPGQARP